MKRVKIPRFLTVLPRRTLDWRLGMSTAARSAEIEAQLYAQSGRRDAAKALRDFAKVLRHCETFACSLSDAFGWEPEITDKFGAVTPDNDTGPVSP